MIKISALNEDSSEESDDEDVPTITKEAQEQIALTEYNKALELLRQKKSEDALALLKDLLETELLDQVEKPEVPDGRPRPMLSLKYSCFKNIGAIQAQLGNYEDAIDNYWEATNLDDTDVMLWYRLGTLATKTYNLELACSSFKYGLKCNPNHWPCLDSIITVLYAVPDYMSCLLYISVALERDSSYIKGLAFRDKIFKDIPNFEECYKVYNSDWQLDPPLDTEYDHIVGDKLLAEARDLAEKWAEACRPEFSLKPLPDLTLNKPVTEFTWLSLGESLISMHKHISDNNYNFVSHVRLDVYQSEESGKEDDNNLDEDNCGDIEFGESVEKQQNFVRIEETFNQIFEDKSASPSPAENKDDNQALENDNDTENFDSKNDTPVSDVKDNNADTDMEVDLDDERKSNSSDIQIIEDEDPLRILDGEDLQLEDPIIAKKIDELDQVILDTEADLEKLSSVKCSEQIVSSEDKSSEKEPLNEKSHERHGQKPDGTAGDKWNDKSSDKPSKTDDKSSEKTEGKEEGRKVKKRRRSSLCFLEQWAWSSGSMRRSARVRSSNRREAERDDVQLEETLRRIFPNSLLPDSVRLRKDNTLKSMEDSMDTMDLYRLFATRENGSNTTEGSKSSESSKPGSPVSNETEELYFGTDQEKADVVAFINEHSEKSNLMIIVAKFTEYLSTKWNHVWPKGLPEMYLQTYVFTREHIPHPSPFNDDADDTILKLDAEMTLLHGELHTDRWLNNKPDILPSSTIDKMGTGLPSEELGQIIFTSVRDDLFNEQYVLFFLRVLWLKANLFMCQGDTDIVIESLESLLCHLKELQGKGDNMFLRLPNCKYNSYISIKVVEKMLTSVQRGRKLGEIQYLHEEKKYSELASILQDTFKFAKQQNKLIADNDVVIDRAEQLSMLLNSLWELEQYEDCYVWAEACLHEAWQNYLSANDEVDQKKWTASILNSLEKLDACVTEVSTFVVQYLPASRLTRLVQNLVHIVCYQLDVPENAIEIPLNRLETVLPWILLHHILQHEEDKERAKTDSPSKNKSRHFNNSDSDEEEEDIPASLMLLFTAHEFLGRRSWCCINEAKLLLFTMNVTVPKLKTPQLAPVKDKLIKYVEQVLYCLYAHPSKTNKTKAKYLEEHGVPQMKLTWEAAQQLYDFYKLDTLPAIDDYKVLSITSEMENLFKRITKLVPPDSDPAVIADDMLAFIRKDKEKMPSVKKPLPYQISSIYYLLGDYYFKSSDWSHGIRYYLLDLCLHPIRFNSWAGLAMATGTQLEIRLNSCQTLKNENSFLDKAKIAQYSYQRASELDPGHSLIWIEYGNFVYMVHSFCSRVLKQEAHKLSMEKFEVLETRKDTMLELAAHCFLSANRLQNESTGPQDDRWLTYYILGKIAEKKNEDPPVFLEHYHKASIFLYENHASYPRKISYTSPHNLSIEALEVYYRIHASILKYLEQHEGKPLKKSLGLLFQQYLKNCADSPFMRYQSKSNHKKGEDDGSDSDGKYATSKDPRKVIESVKIVTTIEQRSNSIEEIEIIDKSKDRLDLGKPQEQIKSENRKRLAQETSDCTKRVKLNNVSHLQLMQDVVALIDDLITKVCEMTNSKDVSEDDVVMLTSSDDNEDLRPEKDKRKLTITDEKDCTQLRSEELHSSVADLSKVNAGQFDSVVKEENIQDLMDELMKQAMEISQGDTQQSFPDDDDTRKSDGRWLLNEDASVKEKLRQEEKKKSPVGIVKDDVALSRRGSQESTTTTQTTTTTETNNSSSSSSDDSTSSDDSSDSDSSSDSESESDSDVEKKKKCIEQKEEFFSDEEVGTLTAYCLAGLEQCVLRFPQHYKSFYRLSHFFFNNKTKDITKCKDLLLGTYNCQFYPGKSFQGLFFERKSSNFFNGVWRIPVEEVDRGGSFASHMSKCITLLMQVLKETNDSDMLMELGLQLSKKPDVDKKYLRDSEREQLSDQAMTLCLQSLRTRVSLMGPPTGTESINTWKNDSRMQVLLDVYKTYQCVQKHCSNMDVKNVADLLTDTYKTYTGNKNIEGNVLETTTKWCQQQIAMNKIAVTTSAPSVNPQVLTSAAVVTSSTVTVSQPSIVPNFSQSPQSRKPHKPSSSSSGRPRGRPPNINKYHQALQQNANMFNQFNPKAGFSNYLGQHNNTALLNPYFMSSLMDPNVLTAMLANMSGNMMDPTTINLATLNYLNQVGGMGGYQEVVRQYQNNLSTIASGLNPISSSVSNISNVSTMSTASSSVNTISNLGHLGHLGNLGGLGNLGNLGNLNNLGGLTMQQYSSLSNSTSSMSRSTPTYHQTTPKVTTTTTTTTTTKEKPNISITPVNTYPSHKSSAKSSKISSSTDQSSAHSSKPSQISQPSKITVHSSAAQVSLLKPSVIQQVKSLPPKQMSAPQIRVSKTLTEPQPAHKSSLSHSPVLKGNSSTSPSSVPQAAHSGISSSLAMKPPIQMNLPSQGSGTSLQHKLLSKKQHQQPHPSANVACPPKKQKTAKKLSSIASTYQSLINSMTNTPSMSQAPFLPAELNSISLSQLPPLPGSKGSKGSAYRKTSSKSKSAAATDVVSTLSNPMSQSHAVEAMSVLSQLQQHSHLEIIPQHKNQPKSGMDFPISLPSSLSVTQQKIITPEQIRPPVSDSMSVYELPRGKSTNTSSNSSKKSEKLNKDGVEIITLDD